jgi:hypothetical protein
MVAMSPAGGTDGTTDPASSDEPTDEPTDQDAGEEEFDPAGFERWRRDSALGTVGTGIAKGLQNVFAPPQDQPVIVVSVPSGPPDPDRPQVILDLDDPTKSVVVFPPARDGDQDDDPTP